MQHGYRHYFSDGDRHYFSDGHAFRCPYYSYAPGGTHNKLKFRHYNLYRPKINNPTSAAPVIMNYEAKNNNVWHFSP